MQSEEQLSKEIEAAIARSLHPQGGILRNLSAAEGVQTAETELRNEEHFWQSEFHSEQIADMQSARGQREEYARKVFILVGGWIAALFVILMAQGSSSTWHPFSDKVLIALICSMTVNLIGTLVIVLKYIFKPDPPR